MTSFIRLMWLALMGVWLTACSGSQNASKQTAFVEYIGHASFRFVDGYERAVVVDPYNSRIWVEHRYPAGLSADAVLVTHPHYDHDATYYFDDAEIFRGPGQYEIGAVSYTHLRAHETLR